MLTALNVCLRFCPLSSFPDPSVIRAAAHSFYLILSCQKQDYWFSPFQSHIGSLFRSSWSVCSERSSDVCTDWNCWEFGVCWYIEYSDAPFMTNQSIKKKRGMTHGKKREAFDVPTGVLQFNAWLHIFPLEVKQHWAIDASKMQELCNYVLKHLYFFYYPIRNTFRMSQMFLLDSNTIKWRAKGDSGLRKRP